METPLRIFEIEGCCNEEEALRDQASLHHEHQCSEFSGIGEKEKNVCGKR